VGYDGRRYLDGSGGAVVVNVGHGREEIAAAMARQAGAAGYVHGTQFTSEVLEEYARRLAAHAPGDCRRLYLLSGGSEATETAVKLARAYHLARGEQERHKVIGRSVSYHGNTLGALSLSGRPTLQAPYLPLLSATPRAAAPFCYHCPLELEYPSCALACAGRSRSGDRAGRGAYDRRLHRGADPGRFGRGGGAARRLHPARARDLPPPRHRLHRRRGS
jgi:adenosylmethionine-8-amino-7-oxononanoate aminotransferase